MSEQYSDKKLFLYILVTVKVRLNSKHIPAFKKSKMKIENNRQ